MNLDHEFTRLLNRRAFFRRGAASLGAVGLSSLLNETRVSGAPAGPSSESLGALPALHFAPKAKRVIYLTMSGGPSHIDLLDYKPGLRKHHGEELPGSIRMGQRITGMTSGQKSFPCVAPMFEWQQHGQSGLWLSELLPKLGTVADDICVIKSMHTEAINHDPAFTFIQTGHQQPGRPSLGAWLSYGIGSVSNARPAVVHRDDVAAQRATRRTSRCFRVCGERGSCRAQHQGVQFPPRARTRCSTSSNPPGMSDRAGRRSHAGRPSAALEDNSWRGMLRRSRDQHASRSTRWRTGCRRRSAGR
jgi:hypothetical protein